MKETFHSIGEWIEDTFGKNETIESPLDRCHFERVADEFRELWAEVDLPSGVGGMNVGLVGSEAADVVIALAGMCRRYGIDLQEEVDRKMDINRSREWEVFKNGTGRHISSTKNWDMLQNI